MAWIDELVLSLPAEYEELARTYLPAIKKMGIDGAFEWLDYLRRNLEIKAHAIIVRNMTNEEIRADGDRGNEILKQLNVGNAAKVNLGWHIIRMILTIGLDRLYEE